MGKANTIQTNFTAGEVSPLMYGRIDVGKYFNGAKSLQNIIVRPQGGALRRPGTRFVNYTFDSSKRSILRDFKFSNVQAYVLEFGEKYVRFYTNGGLVNLPDVVVVSGAGTPEANGEYVENGTLNSRPLYGNVDNTHTIYWNGTDRWIISNTYPTDGLTYIDYNGIDNKVTPDLVSAWTLNGSFPAISLAPAPTVTRRADYVVTPYLEVDLDELYFTQSADVLYICHPLYQTRKLLRHSNTSWELVLYDPTDGPYMDRDSSGATLQVTNVVDRATLTSNVAGAQVLLASASTFVIGDVGKYVEFKDSLGRWTLGLITAYTSATQVTITTVDPSTIVYYSTSSAISVTFSGPNNLTTNFDAFFSWNIGKLIRLTGSQAWYTITGVVNERHGHGTILAPLVAYNTATVTLTVQSGFTGGAVGKYVEYRDDDQWNLALITAFVDSQHVTVNPIDEVIRPNPGAKITFSSSAVHSDVTGVFTPTPGHNSHIRVAGGPWYKLNAYVGSAEWTAAADTMFTYTYPGVTLTLSGRVITANVSASAEVFASTDLGRWLRLEFGSQVRAMKITSVISTTQVTVQLQKDSTDFPKDPDDATIYLNNGYADAFRLGAWSDTTGWPGVCSFHEQRLVFSRTNTQPQTIWGSRSGDYENMSPTEPDLVVLADNAYTYTIASNQVNPVAWMETGPAMLVGTIGAEFQLKATAINEPITPSNVDMKEQTHWGSMLDRPHRVGTAVLFSQRGGNRVREMVYEFSIDAFMSKDLNILAEHILKRGSGIYQSIFQQEPTIIGWYVLNDGTVATMTYERDQEVVAWSLQVLGGGGIVESVTSVPSITGGYDDVYLIVRRTINGSTKRYIERVEIDFDRNRGDLPISMFYVDCGLSYVGSPATTISGLEHLNGATVQVLADGVYVGTRTVSSGNITLSVPASTVHVGFGSICKIVTLEPEGGSPSGTSQGKIKRTNIMSMRIKDTLPFKAGPADGDALLIVQEEFDEIKTGDIRITLEQANQMGISYQFVQDEPVCMNILALMPQTSVNE